MNLNDPLLLLVVMAVVVAALGAAIVSLVGVLYALSEELATLVALALVTVLHMAL